MQDQTHSSDEMSRPTTVQPARLMDPDEVSSSLVARAGEAQHVRGRWFLCGDVSDRFYQLAKDHSGPITWRLSVFHSPDHLPYGVITHQVEASQHRFVLPLYEARMAKCLRQAIEEPLAFSLGHDVSGQAVIQMPPAMPSVWMRMLALHLPLTPASAQQAVEEFPKAVAEACEVDLVSTLLEDWSVQEVSVSALLPAQAVTMTRGKSRSH